MRSLMLVGISVILWGCTSETGQSGSAEDEHVLPSTEQSITEMSANEIEVVVAGRWVALAADLPDPPALTIVGNREFQLEIFDYGNGAYGLDAGFEGCSRFGGPLITLDPLKATSTTVAGIGGCGAEDQYAVALLQQLQGATVVSPSRNELTISSPSVELTLVR